MKEYYWNPKTGRYHDRANNVFISKAEVLKHLETEHTRTKVVMQTAARSLVNGEITLPQFETRMIESLKMSHVRMGLLASGGKNGISNNGYLAMGRALKAEYRYLRNFTRAIASGELTEKAIINRAGLYANSSAIAFSTAEIINRQENGVEYAKRLLDSQAQHCPSCIRHERREWTPINEITPRAVDCECRQRCKCRIIYALGERVYSFR